MDSRYDHLLHEPQVSQTWEAAAIGNPDTEAQKRRRNNRKSKTNQSFSIIMPPPNANDPLHVGHAMFIALEDTLIRFHRMRGDDTVWIPGTDHAGIETQFVFEKKLQKQGKSRFDFSRRDLYAAIAQYVQENSGVAVDQMKKLGASADWSRFRFTLDDDVVKLVLETFSQLYHDSRQLIYRDQQLVNYCTHCGTSYSELEVKYVDRIDALFYVKYPLKDKPGEYVEVATVRPEPIFVDTHLAVHPKDPKHKHLIGTIVLNPLTDAEMTIIGDEFVDPEFGTGIVKLTPAHDPNDFAVAKQHNLPLISAIGFDGKILATGGELAGLRVNAAREKALEIIRSKGLLNEEKTNLQYSHRVGTCYRCGRVIEPLLRAQFFLRVKPLVERVLTALDNNEVEVLGAGHDKILRHWLTNLRDWNLSRQIVWGIRIPVWYPVAGNESHLIVSFNDAQGVYHTGKLSEFLEKNTTLSEIITGIQQVYADETITDFVVSPTPPQEGEYLPETDTFDTWFSSGQWPVVTLKTTQPGDFDRFYPTAVMETGYDILPFWVMRMLLLGYFVTDQTPFRQVYLHGLVRDAKGQKMSKSKGNVVNPLEVIEKYGADALRLALIIRSTPGLDKSVGDGDFKAMRNFTNKIWNAARFTTQLSAENLVVTGEKDAHFSSKLSETIAAITKQLEERKIGLAAETAFNEFWHWYCDEAIEWTKQGQLSPTLLQSGLEAWLKLLHPFTPFVTEAIWKELYPSHDLLALAAWPEG